MIDDINRQRYNLIRFVVACSLVYSKFNQPFSIGFGSFHSIFRNKYFCDLESFSYGIYTILSKESFSKGIDHDYYLSKISKRTAAILLIDTYEKKKLINIQGKSKRKKNV